MITTPSDSELLRRYACACEEAAFAELVRRYLALVYHAAARQLGGRADAADIAQQVFTLLARKAAGLGHHATLAGWLHTTTRNVTRDTLRADRRRRAREQEAFAMQEPSCEESVAHWDAVRPVLDAAIGELSDRDREAVLLRYFAALPLAEVGRRLGLSENAARMRVDRALEKLGTGLGRRGITSSAAALGAVLATPAFAVPAVPAGLAASVTSGALAAGAPAGSALASAIGLMSTGKWLGATAIAFGLLGVVATLSDQRRTAAEAALLAAREEHGRVVESVRRAEAAASAAEKNLAQSKLRASEGARKSSGPAAATVPATSSSSPPTREELVAEGRAFLERHPHVKDALQDYARASLKFQYAPVYRELGLSSEQIEKFENLRALGVGMGSSTADGRSMTLMLGDGAPPDFGRKIEAAIGQDVARRLVMAGSTAAARFVAAEVASELYFTETPLTPAQADRLVEIAGAHRLPRSAGFDWAQILPKAAGVLSAPQLEVLAGRRAGDDFRAYLNRPRGGGAKK